MPVTTYLTDQEMKDYTSVEDEDVDYLLQKLRENDPSWLLQQTSKFVTVKNGWFCKKTEKVTMYILYYNLDGHGEIQIVNLYDEMSDRSFNGGYSTKGMIMNYLMGVINGYQNGMVHYS